MLQTNTQISALRARMRNVLCRTCKQPFSLIQELLSCSTSVELTAH